MIRPVAVVVGYVVRYPLGGMTWVYLQYLLALRDLGFDLVFAEAAHGPASCFDVSRLQMTDDPSYGMAYLRRALADHGLGDTKVWYFDGHQGHGLAQEELLELMSQAAVLINVGGSCSAPEFDLVERRILVDTDAPFTQIRMASGDDAWTRFVLSHDVLATYAVNLAAGTWRCDVPTNGVSWVATRPPLHLPSWKADTPPEGGAWTTVTSWNAYGARSWGGREWRQKDASYEQLRDLPRAVPGVTFELAISSDADIAALQNAGWHTTDPVAVTRTPRAFQTYVGSSRAELAVAKRAYVDAATGAFNDRSLCYLASGRPVVYSETGLDWLPTGEGLVTYSSLETAVSGVGAVEADLERHATAARALAEQYFDAAAVLTELLSAAGVARP